MIPTVETGRLILRAFTLDDFPAYAAMNADPAVMRQMGNGTPNSEEQSWASFLKYPGHWQFMGFGNWAIEEKSSGRFVGNLGFNDRKRDRGPELRNVPEMGWAFVTAASGKGYATEAVRGALAWGHATLGPVRVIALTTAENTASMRVAEKCGFKEFQRALSAGRPRVFFDRIL
jgi:RimJ/RimL family protein N-acetyltransferase